MNGEKLPWRLQRKVLRVHLGKKQVRCKKLLACIIMHVYIFTLHSFIYRGVAAKNLFDDLPLCMKAELFVTMAEPILNKVRITQLPSKVPLFIKNFFVTAFSLKYESSESFFLYLAQFSVHAP